MTTFFTLDQAALAIAADLHPDSAQKRTEISHVFRARMYDALCGGTLIGRDPETRLQIDHRKFSAPIAFGGCVVSERELNAWLEEVGNGVQIDGKHQRTVETARAPQINGSLPGTIKLAADLAPFLSTGRDLAWLKKTLGDVRNRPDLRRYRTRTTRPNASLWRPAGVVLWLISNKYMSRRSGEAALKENYPDDYDLLMDK